MASYLQFGSNCKNKHHLHNDDPKSKYPNVGYFEPQLLDGAMYPKFGSHVGLTHRENKQTSSEIRHRRCT